MAHSANCLVIADAVTSLGGTPLKVDEWGLDAVYSGSQKCLSCPPGLSPISFNERAMKKVKGRAGKVQSWFLDLNLVTAYWAAGAKRVYHHTAPVNALYGLHEALVMLQDERLENAWARHQKNHEALKKELELIGCTLFVPEKERLPQLNAVLVPEGAEDAKIRSRLLNEFGIEIGAGLGALTGRIWRIGLMGHSSSLKSVELLVKALKQLL